MTTIIIKDPLRQAIEAASGGRQTVLYTPKGQASFVTIFNKVDLKTMNPDLSGTHPAFIINGNEVSQLFIGTYQGSIIDGELVSQPWSIPTTGLTYAAMRKAVNAAGKNWHLMTLPEWGLLAAYDNLGVQTLGNNNQGGSISDSSLKGAVIPGQSNLIYSGSGPVQFRLNREYNNVSDLVGNRFQICDGVRFVDGEIQVVANNDAAQTGYDLSLTSLNWKAINGQTGALVAPTGTGTINTDYVATTAASVKISAVGETLDYGIYNLRANIPTLTGANKVQQSAINIMRALGICTISETCSPRGGFPVKKTAGADMRWFRSGSPGHGGYASLNAVFSSQYISDLASYMAEGGTVRPCYYSA
ncbi:TPA: hypothetical protein ACHWOA_004784 [Klebsiella pneumoniae]